jgi:hypothetical protein
MRIANVIPSSGSAQALVVRLINLPIGSSNRSLVEAAYLEEAGIEKNWGQGYTYRLDKRGDHHGGNQLHIFKKNDAWAYRFDGTKSEPNKYSMPATNTVKSIVRDVFNLNDDVMIESRVLSAAAEKIVLEVRFL